MSDLAEKIIVSVVDASGTSCSSEREKFKPEPPKTCEAIEARMAAQHGPGRLLDKDGDTMMPNEVLKAGDYTYRLTGMRSTLLAPYEWLHQQLPALARRETPRASQSKTRATRPRTFEQLQAWPEFDTGVQDMMQRLKQEMPEPQYKELVWAATGSGMTIRAADEAEIRGALIIGFLNHLNSVAEHMGLGTEYQGNGSNRAASFTDLVLRCRESTNPNQLSALILAVVEVKCAWQLDLPAGTDLVQAMDNDRLRPKFLPAVQQAYGDAVLDEAPLFILTTYDTTWFFQRSQQVDDKKLHVSTPVLHSVSEGLPPLAAWLHAMQLAHNMWPKKDKYPLSALAVPDTPTKGYHLSGLEYDLNAAATKGSSRHGTRQQPGRNVKAKQQPAGGGDTQAASQDVSPASSSAVHTMSGVAQAQQQPAAASQDVSPASSSAGHTMSGVAQAQQQPAAASQDVSPASSSAGHTMSGVAQAQQQPAAASQDVSPASSSAGHTMSGVAQAQQQPAAASQDVSPASSSAGHTMSGVAQAQQQPAAASQDVSPGSSSGAHTMSDAISDSTGGGAWDPTEWLRLARDCPAHEAVADLPILPLQQVGYTDYCLSSTSCTRVFKGSYEAQPAVLKVHDPDDDDAVSSFLREARAYLELPKQQGKCVPRLLALGRLAHTGAPLLVLQHAEPCTDTCGDAAWEALRQLHAAGAAHGDIRRSNLLMSGQHVLLTDLETCIIGAEQRHMDADEEQMHACFPRPTTH